MGKKTNLKTSLVMSLFLLAIVSTAGAEIIYVDADASAGGNGQTWGTAYKYLQDALYKPPTSGDEIWVAEGTYKPDEGGGQTPRYRPATFQLISGVALYGGFAGGESSLDERDWETNETTLSGDLLGNDGPDFANNGENSYHVVTGSGTDDTAVLDGFTITAGNANGSYPNSYGGGMYNDGSSPTLTNCTFVSNSADNGGGMRNYNSSSPTLTNCTFSENEGGGMSNYSSSSPMVTNCTFVSNSADYGGGIFNYWLSSPTVTNCTFSGNEHGGMCNWYNSSPTVTNCTFVGNSASGTSSAYGGGMYNRDSSATLVNCTFSGNSASGTSSAYGGGMYNSRSESNLVNCTFSGNTANKGGGMCNDDSSPTVTNCIVWGNTAPSGPQIYNDNSTSIVTYSDIQGGWAGFGNIDDDPCFADPNGADGIVGTKDDNLRLSAGSPCIDAGDNTAVPADTADLDNDADTTERTPLDLDGLYRFVDDP